ncbi:E3 ubiquitin-protein ligase FANCL-like [Phytophthora palmivora]|uniref:E3 ubiquitin-protein ligase FANCL-like n=1 Tax=Phytophthora palmivora TaxID=4796 RepID=A0A2P4X1Z8_9STRA|nr:E3 ubiquitin-protein ligase FANCL-like [Phytophthora palmivora]
MHFVPEDAARSSYRGYVCVEDDEFAVRVSNVAHDTRSGRTVLDAARLDVERALAERLKPHQATLKLRLAQASSLAGFATELEELVVICCRAEPGKRVALPSTKYYTRLMAEVDVVGWNRLRHLSDDLRSLELETKDKAGRSHVVRVLLPLQYETEGLAVIPECLVDAPESFQLQWTGDNPTVLDQVLNQFESFLERFQGFWDALDALDATTCVLEPQHPSRATGRRRLALDRHASVQFEVDPAQPTAMLRELSFFGNEASVGVLRERWGTNAVSKWDETRSLQKNLEEVLEVILPSPKTTKPEEFAVECGICYSYRLEEENGEEVKDDVGSMQDKTTTEQGSRIPDRLCENANCNRPFHAKCLFDWLRALPTSRQSFHSVFGECPYCREAISAKFQPDF